MRISNFEDDIPNNSFPFFLHIKCNLDARINYVCIHNVIESNNRINALIYCTCYILYDLDGIH